MVEWLRPTHDYFLALLQERTQPGSNSAGLGSVVPGTARGTVSADPPVDTEQVPSIEHEAEAAAAELREAEIELLDRRSIVGHLAGAVCSHCQGGGRCYMCDVVEGVCAGCRGTGVIVDDPEEER